MEIAPGRALRIVALSVSLAGGATQAAARGPNLPPRVVLTFDDLPAHGPLLPGQTRLSIAKAILATLRRHRVRQAYGFVTGSFGRDDPDARRVLTAWRRAGHPLGNHSWSHFDLDRVTTAVYTADIERNEAVIAPLMRGQDWRWFRYPYLSEGRDPEARASVRAFLAARGYRIAPVTLNFDDWAYNAPFVRCSAKRDTAALAALEAQWLARADKALAVASTRGTSGKPDIALLHVGSFTAHMLPALLRRWERQGVRFAALSLAGAPGADVTPGSGGSAHQPIPTAELNLAAICT
jgi:peptidoglycan-N-acetylglucosamine deacetylase